MRRIGFASAEWGPGSSLDLPTCSSSFRCSARIPEKRPEINSFRPVKTSFPWLESQPRQTYFNRQERTFLAVTRNSRK